MEKRSLVQINLEQDPGLDWTTAHQVPLSGLLSCTAVHILTWENENDDREKQYLHDYRKTQRRELGPDGTKGQQRATV